MPAVDFSIWDHFENRPGIPPPVQYQEKIRLLREAERLGYYCYHVAEHHVSPLDLAPSPNVFLAALAQATERIHIGTAVYVLPLYNPARLVQELCMLDNISNGRLEMGFGAGVRPIEHIWFGVERAEIRPRFDELKQLITTVLRNGNLEFHGQYYQIQNQPLDLLPVQRPYPPLWYAGGVESAGRDGYNFLTRNPDQLERYWEIWDENRDRPGRLNGHVAAPKVGLTRHMVVRETYKEAEAVARRAWPVFESHWWATPIRLTEDGRPAPQQSASVDADFDQAVKDDARLLIGTPQMVRERLEQWLRPVQNRPTFYFSPTVQWGDITLDEALETVNLIATEVMPAFRPAAVA